MNITKISRVRVLQETAKLSSNSIIKQDRAGKETCFTRYSFFMLNRDKILKLAGNKQAIEKIPTKTHIELIVTSILPCQFQRTR